MKNTGTAFAHAGFSRYGYNDRSELTSSQRYTGTEITDISSPVTEENRAYEYDPIGNRKESVAGTQQALIYETNVLNRYTEISQGASPVTAPEYDDDGNILKYKDKICQWNAENRLISVQPQNPAAGDKKITFLYDYMGRRVRKQVVLHNGTGWNTAPESEKLFVYEGWNMVKETTVTGGAPSAKYYVWGLDLSQSTQGAGGIGGLLCSSENGTVLYYFYDGNGNTGQLINAADGSIAAHYEYDPFGNAVTSYGAYADANPFRFSTKYFDAETGLYYYGFRYYSSELGRWWSRDPVGEEGGMNLCGYALNSPITYYDSLGLFSFRSFADGLWSILTEPINQSVDLFKIGTVMINGRADEDIQFRSMIGNRQNSRFGQGQGTLEASLKGVGDILANIITGGGAGTLDNIQNSYYSYQLGEISLEQLDANLSMGAGAQFGATVTAVGISRGTGNGWTGRGPESNPLLEKQFMVDLIQARQDAGKSEIGSATFGKGFGADGETPVAQSLDYEMSFNVHHAEPQILPLLKGSGPRTVAVDKVPCPMCHLRLIVHGFKGATRVVGPRNLMNKGIGVTQNTKTIVTRAAQGKLALENVGVKTYDVYSYKVILNCTSDNQKKE